MFVFYGWLLGSRIELSRTQKDPHQWFQFLIFFVADGPSLKNREPKLSCVGFVFESSLKIFVEP